MHNDNARFDTTGNKWFDTRNRMISCLFDGPRILPAMEYLGSIFKNSSEHYQAHASLHSSTGEDPSFIRLNWTHRLGLGKAWMHIQAPAFRCPLVSAERTKQLLVPSFFDSLFTTFTASLFSVTSPNGSMTNGHGTTTDHVRSLPIYFKIKNFPGYQNTNIPIVFSTARIPCLEL